MEHDAAVRAIVRRLIEDQAFDGRDELLAQVPFVRVDGGPVSQMALAVDSAAVPPSTFRSGPVPGCAWARDANGEPIGTLVIWIDDGYVSALEYGWVTDQPPTELPTVEQIHH